MLIINNKEEYEDFYPYDNTDINNYPKEYPCIVKCEFIEGGLMGDYKQVSVIYYPTNVSIKEAFYEGLKGNWEILNNSMPNI